MHNNAKHNYFVLTGAMGAGKSTVLNELRKIKLTCIDEPARQILAEQRRIQATGTPEQDHTLFTNLLLSRAMYQYQQWISHDGPVIYDRGIPDIIAYARLFGIDTQYATHAAQSYYYNPMVFLLPAWEEIYENDDERKMSFEMAKSFGADVKEIYTNLGYQIIDVPKISPNERAKFIYNHIN